MRMLANNILVDPEMWTEKKLGSIFLPDNDKAKAVFSRGTVKAVGPGLWLPNGTQCVVEMDVGDHILYYTANSVPIVIGGREMQIVREQEVLAILSPSDFGDETEGETPDATVH